MAIYDGEGNEDQSVLDIRRIGQAEAIQLRDAVDRGDVPVIDDGSKSIVKFRFEDGNDYTLVSGVKMWPSQAADNICNHILPEWLGLFLARNAEYGDQHRESGLGIRAQYVDVNRKALKLKRMIWDGNECAEEREDAREVAMDMIGHLFLLIEMIDGE